MPEFITLEEVLRRQRVGSLGAVVVSEFRESVLLNAFNFKHISGAHDEYQRETELPEAQRRQVHGEFSPSRGTSTMGTEGLRIYGSQLQHDRFLTRTGNFDIVDEVSRHVRSIRLFLEHEMVYGDPWDEDDPGQIMGLQFLAENSYGNEAETLVSAGNDVGGSPLSLRGFQDAMDNCYPGATMIVCGTSMKNVITTGSKDVNVSGHINWAPNSYGTKIAFFNETPILTVDRDHTNTKMLEFTEPDATGGPATTGSIYIVSHRPEQGGYYPFMNGGPFIEEDSNTHAPLKKRDVEWYVSVNRPQPTSVVRLRHIANAPMVP